MKDSRLGTYASIGLFLLIAIRISAVFTLTQSAEVQYSIVLQSTLPENNQYTGIIYLFISLISAAVVSRASVVWIVKTTEYRTTDLSKVKPVAESISLPRLLISTGFALAILFVLQSPIDLWSYLIIASLMTLLLRKWFLKKIGGYTGDTLGFSQQIIEITLLLLMASGIKT